MFRKTLTYTLAEFNDTAEPSVSNVIQEALVRAHTSRLSLDPQRSSLVVHGCGTYQCDTCHNHWNCLFSWVNMDIRRCQVLRRWRMKCKYCSFYEGHLGIEPAFRPNELELLVRNALSLYRGFNTVDRYDRLSLTSGGPHPRELCEKCEWGLLKCWDPFVRSVLNDRRVSLAPVFASPSAKDYVRFLQN
ncbi:hypothetical protein CDAR_244511 [Caerostris darwini]|uniref:3CxxC-type domain-containing protein n=1 Tax=Caerostris darwini TaxID=1538125 RepID=A0AAV4RD22_9ARAC|nr:hypothetical protein CDAR_244511 [Caerostris darwini]